MLGSIRALVVDDNKTSREILFTIAKGFGLRADIAATGEEALSMVTGADAADPYQLLVIDWQMPGMDGISVAEKLQQDTGLQIKPKIIIVTAFGREDAHSAAGDTVLSAVLSKPVTPSSLLDAIMTTLGHEVSSDNRVKLKTLSFDQDIKKLKGAKVLLVEDNEVNREVALDLLISNGLQIEVAVNGADALEALKKQTFDGVLMDCQMPVMDGYEATRILRRDERFKDLPVLAMTANAMAGDREKVLDAGMNDHIAKPVDVQKMFAVMAQWITPRAEKDGEVGKTPETSIQDQESAVLPELPGLDTVNGLSRLNGNVELYLKILRKVSVSQRDFIVNFKEAAEHQDWKLAERLAHTLKGLAGNIGADNLSSCCAKLEEMAGKEKVDEQMLQETEIIFSDILQNLDCIAQSPTNPEQEAKEDIDISNATTAWKTFVKQLEEYDTDAVKTLQKQKVLMRSILSNEHLQSIEDSLSSYDFVAAQKLSREIDINCEEIAPCISTVPVLIEHLCTLEKLIEDYNTEALDYLEKSADIFQQYEVKNRYQEIYRALEKYDFPTALSTVQETTAMVQKNTPSEVENNE